MYFAIFFLDSLVVRELIIRYSYPSLHFVQVFPHDYRVATDDNGPKLPLLGRLSSLTFLDLDRIVQNNVEELVVALEDTGDMPSCVEPQIYSQVHEFAEIRPIALLTCHNFN